MDYAEFKARAKELEAEAACASATLKAIPGVGSGALGLTPDAVKFSPAFREAKAAFTRAFQAQRDFHGTYGKRFEKEARAERRARFG